MTRRLGPKPRQIARLMALLATLGAPVHAVAEGCATDAMLVFDGSGSMVEYGYDPRRVTRIKEARQAIAKAMPQVEEFRRIGLLIYGPNTGDSCSGLDLRFRPRLRAAGPIIEAVNALSPGGLTPLAASVDIAAKALNHRTQSGVIVVVTDGNETCGGLPCATADRLAREARDLTIHVIGFRAIVDFWTWDNPEQEAHQGQGTVARCLADRTGGQYVTADTVDSLIEALQTTLGCPLYGQGPIPAKPPKMRQSG